MVSSGMLRRVALVRTDVSEKLSATRRNIPEDTILQDLSLFVHILSLGTATVILLQNKVVSFCIQPETRRTRFLYNQPQ
jgi:hypothetical protein